MKANIQNIRESDRISTYRKERGFYRQISILDPADGSDIITARFYWPGESICYCCIWVYGNSVHGSGAGRAGGYGYHKKSAALSEAIADSGIKLSDAIGGRGDSAMYAALDAIARAVTGKRKFFHKLAHA